MLQNVLTRKYLKVKLRCAVDQEKLILLSQLVYDDAVASEETQKVINCRYETDKDMKILRLFFDGKIINFLGQEQVLLWKNINLLL